MLKNKSNFGFKVNNKCTLMLFFVLVTKKLIIKITVDPLVSKNHIISGINTFTSLKNSN